MNIDEYPQYKEDFRIPINKERLANLCQKLCDEPKIRFCGVINSLGRIITGGFKHGIMPIDNEALRRMLYIQSTLELSMKGEFNDTLGDVNYITTYRDNVAIIIIPMQENNLMLMSVERNAEIEQIVKKTTSLISSHEVWSENKSVILRNNSPLFSECS